MGPASDKQAGSVADTPGCVAGTMQGILIPISVVALGSAVGG